MNKSRRVSPYTDAVKTERWRKDFLDEINVIDGFEGLVRHSRSATQLSEPDQRLKQDARRIIESRDRDELTIARQYYNNAHLLVFWRLLKEDINKGYSSGRISREFPLFQIKRGVESGSIVLEGATVEFLDKVHFDLDESTLIDSEAPATELHELPVLLKLSADSPRRQQPLNQAFMRLSLVTRIALASLESCYSNFIEQQRLQQSPIQDYYRIHCFLDNFLYINESGSVRRANYDAIFGNSSLYELKLYLQYNLDNKILIGLKEVEAFLERQRKFYLSLALDITLEENEVHNQRKNLLAYDAESGVVHAQNINPKLISHYHKTVIESFGVVKQNGCPFAMSVGTSGNALLEVFQYFDTIFLHLLHHSIDFKKVFGK